MKLATIVALIALGSMLSGCATIIQGTTQDIAVTSTPADGAKCELKNSEGVWYVTTPGNAHVHKTKNDLTVTCTKDGYQDVTVTVPSKFGGTTAGNILAGGVIGIGIDAASGANYYYPDSASVLMVPKGGAVTPAAVTPAAPAANGGPPST